MSKYKTIIKKCLYCNNEFNANIYSVKKGFGKYCSKQCSNSGTKIGVKKPPITQATKDKIRKTLLSKHYHVIHSQKTKDKISLANKHKHLNIKTEFKKGKLHPNWKGGINRDKHNSDYKYIRWRKKVFIRDNYTCQKCGNISSAGNRIELNAHHIKPWAKYEKSRYIVNNGITVCFSCHKKIHNEMWKRRLTFE